MATTIEKQKRERKQPSALQEFFSRMGILGELLAFLWKQKLYWLIPMVITLLIFAVIIIIGSTGPGGVFIYSIF